MYIRASFGKGRENLAPAGTANQITAAPPPAASGAQGSGSGGMEAERLRSALEATRLEADQSKQTTAKLSGQLRRALEAIKLLEGRLRAASSQNNKHGSRSQQQQQQQQQHQKQSRAQTASLEAKIKSLEATNLGLQAAVAKLKKEHEELSAAGLKCKLLEEKLKYLSNEHEDLLVLLATEELDKQQIQVVMESLQNENAALRQRLGLAVHGGAHKAAAAAALSSPPPRSNGHTSTYNSNGGSSSATAKDTPGGNKSNVVRSLGQQLQLRPDGGKTPVRERRDPIDQLP
mmetsp:Transcript_1851/g.3362  ORF Transcript_1851/g.3362 Transcript_1851/m.3362 type:complete len:289 (+) Transcript_1851:341-1207(+)